MKKLFLITFISIFFIGCLEPSQEKLDSNWVKAVKGKTFFSALRGEYIIFDDAGNISIGNASEDEINAGDVIVGLLSNMMKLEFFRSPEKNKAIYKIEILFMSAYTGFSTDGKKLYLHDSVDIPDDMNWEIDEDQEVYLLYKGE